MAVVRKRPSKKPSRKRDGAQASRWDPITIPEQDVVVLKVAADVGRAESEDIVFRRFAGAVRQPPTTAWLAFAISDQPHCAGQSPWIGLSRSTPQRVVDAIATEVERGDLDVSREICRVPSVPMLPFARLSSDGFEILVPAALTDLATRRSISRGGVDVWARGYQMAPSKSAAIQSLFFGSGDSRRRWWHRA